MKKCHIVSGNILNGGHRIIVVGINCRDNCSSVAIALGSALDFAVTDLTRAAEDSAVGRFVKLAIQRPPTEEIIGLVLRMDHRRPVRLEDLRSAIRHLMQYLGARQDLSPRDVAMVAIGTGAARIEGGSATLLRILNEEGYPGVVYEPLDPGARLSEDELERLGGEGRPRDALSPWTCRPSTWTADDERAVVGRREHPHAIEHTPIGMRDSYLTGEDADQG